MADNFWRTKNQGDADFAENPSCEPDLRREFDELIQGHLGCEGIGQLMVLRQLDHSKPAHGYDKYYGGSTDDPWDEQEIFQWTEKYVLGHFTQTFGRALSSHTQLHQLRESGYWDKDKALIYLMSDSGPKTGDSIFRLNTNKDGNAYYPIERIEKWKVVNVEDRRQEKRKVAFYICVCERVEV